MIQDDQRTMTLTLLNQYSGNVNIPAGAILGAILKAAEGMILIVPQQVTKVARSAG